MDGGGGDVCVCGGGLFMLEAKKDAVRLCMHLVCIYVGLCIYTVSI